MSLKAFHFAFICISILLSAYFGGWCVRDYSDNQTTSYLIMGIGSFMATASLVVYLAWFLKKSRHIGFLMALFCMAGTLISNQALACSVCFGNPSHPLTRATNSGVWFLLIVVSGVLVGFASLFLYWAARARRLGL